MSPLLWTCDSTTELAKALMREGYTISADTVGRLLANMDYSLQANMKSLDEGGNHPDRDRQLRYLSARCGGCNVKTSQSSRWIPRR